MLEINILGISASPREGNSMYLLQEALNAAKEVNLSHVEAETYSIKGKTFKPCIHCYACQDKLNGECAIKDDFQELRNKWVEADVIIYSVPVYHMSIPGQLKCFIDRLGNSLNTYYNHKYEEKGIMRSMKVIGSIAQGRHIFSGQEHTLTDLINHTILMGSVPLSADLWEAYIGVGGWTANKRDKNSIKKLNNKKDFDASITVKACRNLGKRSVELASILIGGALEYRSYLEKDPSYAPLLRRSERFT